MKSVRYGTMRNASLASGFLEKGYDKKRRLFMSIDRAGLWRPSIGTAAGASGGDIWAKMNADSRRFSGFDKVPVRKTLHLPSRIVQMSPSSAHYLSGNLVFQLSQSVRVGCTLTKSIGWKV